MQLPLTLLVELSDDPKERIRQGAAALHSWEAMLKELGEGGLAFTDAVGTPVTRTTPTGAKGGGKPPRVTVIEGPKEAA